VQTAILVSVIGLIASVWMASLALANRLGRLEEKVDVVHDWFMSRIDIRVGGRRHTDIAADDGPET
jgi:hypothetical protein